MYLLAVSHILLTFSGRAPIDWLLPCFQTAPCGPESAKFDDKLDGARATSSNVDGSAEVSGARLPHRAQDMKVGIRELG